MYDFDKIIERGKTADLKWNKEGIRRFLGVEADGETLPMWIADMDFQTAPCIIEALRNRADFGIFGYVGPTDSYYDAVCWWMKKRHGWNVEKDWIVTTAGIIPAINTAVRAFTGEGDSVVIQTPVYHQFRETIELTGRTAVENPLTEINGRYVMDFEGLDCLTRRPDVKMLLLCSPHNPVGRVWDRDELRQLGEICERNHVLVLSDEIHSDIVYNGHKHIPFSLIEGEAAGTAIICTAPSKTFNVPGLKCSNIIIKDAAVRSRFQKQRTAMAMHDMENTFGETMLRAAYTKEGEDWLEAAMKYLEGTVGAVERFLKERMPQVRLIHPESCYLVWLDFRDTGRTEDELYEILVHQARVIMNRGSRFGDGGQGYFRFNIAAPRAVVIRALEQIAKALKENVD